ncbi:polysaccharide lyase family 8 protein [Mycena vitilis]|nr:polysaccharide lyase family 8 protein [Mycena vitilis]
MKAASFVLYFSALSRSSATSQQPVHAQSASQNISTLTSTQTTTATAPTGSGTPQDSQTSQLPVHSHSASQNISTPVSTISTPTSIQTTSTAAPTDSGTAQDIQTLTQRRLSNIVGALTNASSIPAWLSTLDGNGQWPDVDYTTGCPAQRANWPAEFHWNRISTMAGAWHGGLTGAEQYVKDPALRDKISLAMGYWFANDFKIPACLDSGGTATCPCGTPGLWNTNWFPNIIGTPELVSMTCLLLSDNLLQTELGNCTTITGRAYATFIHPANQVGVLTGANALDVAKIGIDLALLTLNASILTDAYARVHSQLVITTPPRADGIRPDGSFGQHSGILYNGNYGKDFTNDVVDLEVEAGGTQFQASPASQTAFATLFDGDAWMIYTNVLTGILHWDFSALGRFISFPATDSTQATASILLNLTKIGVLGDEWSSDTLVKFSDSLSQNSTTANAGNLIGNRMFYDNDYMVHRGAAYVTTLKMYSTRSTNTECTNLANPFGFHLSDGALRTYLQGNEYEDIAAAMDWNRIPGTTIDYGATPLNCAQTGSTGVETFVGGASDGHRGVAAMRYTNPLTHNLHWQKAWFFLDDDVQVVTVSNISSASNATVISVLDQKLHSGPVIVDSIRSKSSATSFAQHGLHSQSFWHDNVGYTFPDSPAFSLSLEVGPKTGNWSTIGTSTQPPNTVDLFSAWVVHESLNSSLAYTIYPGTDFFTFAEKSSRSRISVLRNDALVSAVFDQRASKAMGVFWATGGGSTDFALYGPSALTVSTNGTAAVLYDLRSGLVTVSDPTQTLSALCVTLHTGNSTRILDFTLPSGGSSVSQYA